MRNVVWSNPLTAACYSKSVNKTRRNHYVPRFLSSAFTDETGSLFFAINRPNELAVKRSSPTKLFAKRDLYRHDGELINVTTDVEENFSTIESQFSPIHRRILEEIRNGIMPNLNFIAKSRLITFIMAQSRRTLDRKICMQKMALDIIHRKMESAKREIEKKHGPLSPEDEDLMGPKAQVEYANLIQLNGMASLSLDMQSRLQKHVVRYLKIQNPKLSFVVGSNPVVFYEEAGRVVPSGQIKDAFLAISYDIALKLTAINRGPRIVNLNRGNIVQEWNEKIRDQSTVIAGRSKPLIRSLSRRWN